jgi:hypothetical protein
MRRSSCKDFPDITCGGVPASAATTSRVFSRRASP